jgi:type IV pilus assembly protein PilB
VTIQSVTGPARKRVGELLIESGLVDDVAVERALARQKLTGTALGEILLDEGLVSDADLAAVLSFQLDTPLVDLGLERTDDEALKLVPEDLAKSRHILPIRIEDGGLVLAMAFPSDQRTLAELRERVTIPIRPLLALRSDIDQAITQRYRVLGNVHAAVGRFEKARTPAPQLVAPLLAGVDETAPVVQILNLILTQALRDRASDIHIEPQENGIRIRYRIDGTLHDATKLPKDLGPAIASRVKVMANLNIVEKRRSQDGQISLSMDDHEADVRVSTIETIWGEKIVMRILDKTRSLIDVRDLGMETGVLERWGELLKSPFGMLLVCGPTGTGKTTTLYASVNELDRTTKNVMTIEDPVEYIIDGTSQIPINLPAGRTFATGLRSILRQDPDVILVGEIRDQETVEISMNAALTGHLVLTSIHSIDTIGAVYRLLDLGVERFMVTSSLVAVTAQRLVRKLCDHCKTEQKPQMLETALLRQAHLPSDIVYLGRGCNYCAGTGYLGRMGVYELLIIGEELRNGINRGASSQELRSIAQAAGLVTLREAGLRKVAEGLTSTTEVLAMLQGAS